MVSLYSVYHKEIIDFVFLWCVYVALFGMDGIDGDDRATHFIQLDDDDESTSTDGK